MSMCALGNQSRPPFLLLSCYKHASINMPQRCLLNMTFNEHLCSDKYHSFHRKTGLYDSSCIRKNHSRYGHINMPIAQASYSSVTNDNDSRKSFSDLKPSPLKLSPDYFSENREAIIARLKERDFRKNAPRWIRKMYNEGAGRSAVFLPFCLVNEEPSILFTLRSTKLTSHRGLVSFPGGKMDATDVDMTHTALREMEEELAIPESCVDIWGELTPRSDQRGIFIQPIIGFIGHLESLDIQMNPDEVETVFTMTLSHLSDPKNRRVTLFENPTYYFKSPVWKTREHTVWGLSALMLEQALSVILPNDYVPLQGLGATLR